MKSIGSMLPGKVVGDKIILVTRPTRLQELIGRFNTEGQARFYIEHLGGDFDDYSREDACYREAAERVRRILARHGRVQVLERRHLSNFMFGPEDKVVVLGQDGLVANVLKYLDQQPVVGVNPEPDRWEGVLLPYTVPQLDALMPRVMAANCALREVTMAQVSLNTGEVLYGVNDLFIGPRSHASARYEISLGPCIEQQSSSGVIVSTGLGSTGWLRSVVAGATGIAAALAGKPVFPGEQKAMPWDANYLCFSVREPWPSRTTSADITFGRIGAGDTLTMTSLMPEGGVIFSDGMEADFLNFNSGTQARIQVADKRGYLVA